ncbi:MAG: hypothetical protein ACJ8C4_09700 [Gemmataceae bacterium]
MGENVLKGQVENFKKGSDRSLKNMATPTLFGRPDIMSTVYTAAPLGGSEVAAGDHLEGHAAANGRCIHLVNGHKVIGKIDGDGAKSLLDALRAPGHPGVTPMMVRKVSSVSGFIEVVVDDGTRAA